MSRPVGNYAELEMTLERTHRELETAWTAYAALREKYDACVKQCTALERDNKRLSDLLYDREPRDELIEAAKQGLRYLDHNRYMIPTGDSIPKLKKAIARAEGAKPE